MPANGRTAGGVGSAVAVAVGSGVDGAGVSVAGAAVAVAGAAVAVAAGGAVGVAGGAAVGVAGAGVAGAGVAGAAAHAVATSDSTTSNAAPRNGPTLRMASSSCTMARAVHEGRRQPTLAARKPEPPMTASDATPARAPSSARPRCWTARGMLNSIERVSSGRRKVRDMARTVAEGPGTDSVAPTADSEGSLAPAVTRAVAVLDALAADPGVPLGTSELSRRLGLPKSSIANICGALVDAGLLRRAGVGFALGRKLAELGGAYLATVDQVHEFYTSVDLLQTASEETIQLGVLDGTEVTYVARHDGTQPIRLASGIGRRLPASCTAMGKAMLASLRPEELADRYRGIRWLPTMTQRSHRTTETLFAELETVRQVGHAIDEEETAEGVVCFAVANPRPPARGGTLRRERDAAQGASHRRAAQGGDRRTRPARPDDVRSTPGAARVPATTIAAVRDVGSDGARRPAMTLALFRVAIDGPDGQPVTRLARGDSETGPDELLPAGLTIDGLLAAAAGRNAIAEALATTGDGSASAAGARVLAPVEHQEVWAAGVTYERSRDARMDESATAATVYDQVYDAERPELFFKAPGWRVRGPGEPIGIRADSTWDVPEPELALVVAGDGRSSASPSATTSPRAASRARTRSTYHRPRATRGAAPSGRASCLPPPWWACSRSPSPSSGTASRSWMAQRPVPEIRRSFDELAGWLTRAMPFPVGAVLLTGTGIVPETGFSLRERDVVRIAIAGLGVLENPVERVGRS